MTQLSHVKIFGERNTSTNALKQVIEQNSAARVLPSVAPECDPRFAARLALMKRLHLPVVLQEWLTDRVFARQPDPHSWKHAATDFGDVRAFSDTLVVFCTRHPASWLLGLYKRPYHNLGRAQTTLPGFVTGAWKTVGRERLAGITTTPAALYNLKLQSYARMQAALDAARIPHVTIRHEDFAMDQRACFDRLRPHLSGVTPDFTPLDTSTKDSAKSSDYYRDYYGQERWRAEIDPVSAQSIQDSIDWPTAAAFGYQP